jgi:hypothetical protein
VAKGKAIIEKTKNFSSFVKFKEGLVITNNNNDSMNSRNPTMPILPNHAILIGQKTNNKILNDELKMRSDM